MLGCPALSTACHAILIPATTLPTPHQHLPAYLPRCLLTCSTEIFKWLISKPKRSGCRGPAARQSGPVCLSLVHPWWLRGFLLIQSNCDSEHPSPRAYTRSFYVASEFLVFKQHNTLGCTQSMLNGLGSAEHYYCLFFFSLKASHLKNQLQRVLKGKKGENVFFPFFIITPKSPRI